MLKDQQITKLVDFARDHPGISAMYLFGSHATMHARSKSDIDLGVLFNKDIDGFERIEFETKISNLLKCDVDLVDMKKCSPFMRHQIYRQGNLIYHDGSDFPFLFRANSIRDYLDMNYLIKLRRNILYGQ